MADFSFAGARKIFKTMNVKPRSDLFFSREALGAQVLNHHPFPTILRNQKRDIWISHICAFCCKLEDDHRSK